MSERGREWERDGLIEKRKGEEGRKVGREGGRVRNGEREGG